jgi:hypothetical protein
MSIKVASQALGSYHPSSPISGWRLGKAEIRIPIRKVEAPFLLCSDYFTPGGVKLFPLKRVSYIVEFLPLVGYLYLCFLYL